MIALAALVVATGLLAWQPHWMLAAEYARLRWAADATEHTLDAADHRWAYLEAGRADAPLIVLAHGFTGIKESWLPLMADLRRDYRVIAPDLAGWNASSRQPDADYGIAAQAERLAAFIEALDARPALLVGHSMGGHIAALVAARHPQHVQRLALVSASGVPFEANDFGRAVLDGAHPFAVEDRATLDRYLGLVFTDPPFVPWPVDRAFIAKRIADRGFELDVLARQRSGEAFAVQPLLGDIAAPTLLLWCDDDRVIDPSAAAAYAAGLHESRTAMLAGCGHMPMMADVAGTAAALRGQLGGE